MAQENYQRADQENRQPRGRADERNAAEQAAWAARAAGWVPLPVPMMVPQMQPPMQQSRSRSRSGDRWAVHDYIRRQEKVEEEKKRAVEAWEAEQAAKKRREKVAQEAWEAEQVAKKKREKEEQDAAVRKWQEEEAAKKAKEKHEWEEFERKRKEKIAEEAEKKTKEDEAYKERLMKDLRRLGFQENQIDAIADEKKKKKGDVAGVIAVRPPHGVQVVQHPVYPKVRRTDIAIETLKYYNLPWEYDRADADFIIILQELSERDTDILFEHTRRLRGRTVLKIEEIGRGVGGKPQFAWVRKRSKSRGKSPVRDKIIGKLLG